MERLAKENINTSEEYNRKYFERKKEGVDKFDLERWHLLIKYYKKGKLVDLGCLDSLVPILARKKDPQSEIWAIDIAEEAMQDMQSQYPSQRIFWQRADVYSTKFFKPWELIYTESLDNMQKAREREKQIKSWKGGNAFKKFLSKAAGSSNGRTAPFEGVYLGSNPSPAALERRSRKFGGVK